MSRMFYVAVGLAALIWFVHRHDPPMGEASLAPSTPAAMSSPAKSGLHKPEPLRISHGERVDIRTYATSGKYTVFDFYSDYCPPCRALKPKLEEMHATHDDVNLVVVDVNRPGVRGIDWQAPVVQQYDLHSIPHLVVYGPQGKIVAQDTGEGHDGYAFCYQHWGVSF